MIFEEQSITFISIRKERLSELIEIFTVAFIRFCTGTDTSIQNSNHVLELSLSFLTIYEKDL